MDAMVYEFWLYGFVYTIFSKFKLFYGLADNHIRDVTIMIEPTNHTGITSSPSSCTPTPSISAERPVFDDRRDISKTSSKYILDGNKIVFERYDHNGKLISRVPWTAHSISEKA
jgi:hypothetical protein